MEQNGLSSTKRPHTKAPCLCNLPTFHCNQTPAVYREPFIMTGYRKANSSFSECLCYLFVLHNDVWNFWSSFLSLLVWLSWLYYLSHHVLFSEPYYHPLLCFWIGSSCYAMFSSIAHMFGCMSATVRSICFMVDYLGISVYVAGGGMYSYHHQLPLSSQIYDHMFPVLCLHLLLCVCATILSSLSRFYWLKHRFVIRAVAFTPATLSSFLPLILRLTTCVSKGADCISHTLHLHILSMVVICLLTFFFVSKIPERFAPGKFDISCFQSHTLFHAWCILLTSIQMYIFPIDSELRKTVLLDRISSSSQKVFRLFLLVVVIDVLLVSGLSVLVVKGFLNPNKVQPPSQQKQE